MAYDLNPATVVSGTGPGNPYDQYGLDENGNVSLLGDNYATPAGNGPVPDIQPPVPPQAPLNPADVMATATGQPAPVVPPQSTAQSHGQSVSVSRDGFSPNMFEAVSTASKKGMAKGMAEANNLAAGYEAKLNDGLDQIGATKKAATENVTNLEADKMDENAQLEQELAGMQRQNALDNEATYQKIQAKTAGYMADYEHSILDLVNSVPNPGRAYSQMSGSERAGTAITAFVQDFLGAKGIKTSGLDLIHKAVDMDLEAQREAYMGKKDQVAGKFNIYQLHKEQGDSDYLAAVKTRATLLEAAKMEATAKLALMDAPIARAKIPLLNAQIDEQQLNYKRDAAKAAMDVFEKAAQREVTLNGQRLQASMEGRRLALEEKRFKAQQDAAKAGDPNKGFDPSLFIRDTDGNVAIQAPNKEVRNELQKTVTGTEQFIKGLAKLSDDVKAAGATYSGLGSGMMRNALEAKYASDYHSLLSNYIKMQSGAQASDKEVDRLMKVIPFDTWTTGVFSGDSGAEIVQAALASQGVTRADDLLEQVRAQGVPVDPEVAGRFKGAITPGAFETTQARQTRFSITDRGDDKPTKTEVDKAIGIVDSNGEKNSDPVELTADQMPGTVDTITSGGRNTKPMIWDVAQEAGLLGDTSGGRVHYNPQYVHVDADGNVDPFGHGDVVEVKDDGNFTVPRWLTGMDKLATVAVDPGASEAERSRAIDALMSMTKVESVTGNPSEDQQSRAMAATYYLQKLAERPNSVNYGK